MPHTKSAWKRLRQTEKRRARNRAAKKAIKVQIKKFLVVLKDGSPEEKKTEFLQAIKKLDKAGVRRVLHPNTVQRRGNRRSGANSVSPLRHQRPRRLRDQTWGRHSLSAILDGNRNCHSATLQQEGYGIWGLSL